MIVIEMDNGRTIKIELDHNAAPITAANFEELVKEGFYDGLTFHRVICGFMIQGGDPLGNGMGGSKKTIKGEFASNGVNNPIEHLDGNYAAFGHVVEGMDAVDEIAAVRTDMRDKPLTPVVMKRVYIEE